MSRSCRESIGTNLQRSQPTLSNDPIKDSDLLLKFISLLVVVERS